jgi:pimeloyl-ACP methyl ester carboxylesterase
MAHIDEKIAKSRTGQTMVFGKAARSTNGRRLAVDMDQQRHDMVTMVPTRLGNLRVQLCGSGRTAVLWHSLFVDSTTWQRVREPLAVARRLLIIDGPSHGGSAAATRMFRLDECSGAALDILEYFSVAEPVDWVGNAWGGHVGILFAATSPDRCRSLVTIGTPVHALTPAERRKLGALVTLYRFTGPLKPLVKAVSNALLGPRTAASNLQDARLVGDTFRRPNRRGMYLAIRSVSLNRPDLTPVLATITAPTLLVAGTDDLMWTPIQACAAATHLPHGACAVVPGEGHVAPLLEAAPTLVELLTAFWQDPARVVTRLSETPPKAPHGPSA